MPRFNASKLVAPLLSTFLPLLTLGTIGCSGGDRPDYPNPLAEDRPRVILRAKESPAARHSTVLSAVCTRYRWWAGTDVVKAKKAQALSLLWW